MNHQRCETFFFSFSVCGAQLNAVNTARTFYSHPAYGDDNYSPSVKCTWTLSTRNGFVKLRFKEFDLEKEKYCSYDAVTIRDGSNATSPLLGKICGNSAKIAEREFLSTGNKMFIEFVTDLTTQKKGFIAEYGRIKRNRRNKLKKYKTGKV